MNFSRFAVRALVFGLALLVPFSAAFAGRGEVITSYDPAVLSSGGDQAGTTNRSTLSNRGIQVDPDPLPLIPKLDQQGPRACVIGYGTDMTGFVGASNLVNTLNADGRFSSVLAIDGDIVLPDGNFLNQNCDCVTMSTDNRSGVPLPAPIADSASNAAVAFHNTNNGGVTMTTFGFSHRPTGGIGFGNAAFVPGLSPLLQATPFFNAAAGAYNFVSTTGPCAPITGGGVLPANSSWANFVSLAPGATLCANYNNGQNFLAINTTGRFAGFNGFPFDQNDNTNPQYRRLISNTVFTTCRGAQPPQGGDVEAKLDALEVKADDILTQLSDIKSEIVDLKAETRDIKAELQALSQDFADKFCVLVRLANTPHGQRGACEQVVLDNCGTTYSWNSESTGGPQPNDKNCQ